MLLLQELLAHVFLCLLLVPLRHHQTLLGRLSSLLVGLSPHVLHLLQEVGASLLLRFFLLLLAQVLLLPRPLLHPCIALELLTFLQALFFAYLCLALPFFGLVLCLRKLLQFALMLLLLQLLDLSLLLHFPGPLELILLLALLLLLLLLLLQMDLPLVLLLLLLAEHLLVLLLRLHQDLLLRLPSCLVQLLPPLSLLQYLLLQVRVRCLVAVLEGGLLRLLDLANLLLLNEPFSIPHQQAYLLRSFVLVVLLERFQGVATNGLPLGEHGGQRLSRHAEQFLRSDPASLHHLHGPG